MTSPTPEAPAAPPATRKRWLFIAGGVVLLVLLGAFAWSLAGGRSFEVSGMLVLDAGCGEAGSGGYSDIREGTQVVVSDASGATVATGELGSAVPAGRKCSFDFAVPGVPAGHDFYGLEVSHRGVLRYPAEKIREADIIVSLG